MLLKELAITNHFKQRVVERIDNIEISLPFNLSSLQVSEDEILKRLKSFYIKAVRENSAKVIGSSEEGYAGFIIADLYVEYKGKSYKPTLIAKDQHNSTGSAYYIVADNGNASTFILSSNVDEAYIRKAVQLHLENKHKTKFPFIEIAVTTIPDAKIIAKIEDLAKESNAPTLPEVDTLAYTPKADYRKDSSFTHKQYGTGVCVTTSNGTGGVGDMNGKLEWVDVDFKKTFLKDGKLTSIRRIPNVYTISGLKKAQQKSKTVFESIRFKNN